MRVYEAICAVTEDLSKIGIAKDKKNSQQGYQFRGIDDVYGALSPLLAKHKLCILPRVKEKEVVERASKSGGALFYTTLTVDFDIVADDGSKHTVTTVGEAMDSADKGSNKAQSAAFKYACFMTFCIPTEGDNDADATTHEVAPKPSKPKKYDSESHSPRAIAGKEAALELTDQRKDDLSLAAKDIEWAIVKGDINSALKIAVDSYRYADENGEIANHENDRLFLWSLLSSKARSALNGDKNAQ